MINVHDDVPEEIRQQLYVAMQRHYERQQYERHHKAADKSDSELPSIVIKNVPPDSQSDTHIKKNLLSSWRRLVISGFCDTAVEEYSEWQMSRAKRNDLREGV
jgi:hypothetical protein